MNSYSFFKCYMKMCNLNIMDYVSFRTCVKPLRKVDHLTLDVPFSTTETHYTSLSAFVACGMIYR